MLGFSVSFLYGSFYDSISRLGKDLERRGHRLIEVLSRLRRPDEHYDNPTDASSEYKSRVLLYTTLPYLRKAV